MDICTERLFIRELSADDWQSMKRIALDFRQSEYVTCDQPLPVEEDAIRDLTARFADTHLFFAVLLRDSPKMIGYVCFHDDNGNYDLGYCFHSAYHGKGYALESCGELMKYMEEHCEVKQFTAGTALKNIPSCRLLEKLGFVLKEMEELSFHKDEEGRDIVFTGGIFIKVNETGGLLC